MVMIIIIIIIINGAMNIHEAVNSGCLSSSDEEGLSSVFTSRHLRVRSFRAGFENEGRGGWEEAWPI